MKKFVLATLLAVPFVTTNARAAAVFGGDQPVQVHEDYVFLHYDEVSKREHILFAARFAPAFRRVHLGIPTPSAPTIEDLVADLPEALHRLVAPHEMRAHKHPPAPPVPWIPNGARLEFFTVNAGSADQIFDPGWTKSYVDKGFSIATLAVVTPDDKRLEVLTPTGHISFESERLVLVRREPPLAVPKDDDGDDDFPDKPSSPFEVTVSDVVPKNVGIDADKIAEVMRSDPELILACYERFLEQSPNTKWAEAFEATARPNGHSANVKVVDGQASAKNQEMTSCVQKVLQTKRTPRTIDGYTFQVRISLRPPHVPGRRTHVVAIGSSKYVWRNQPASVRLEDDFEILPQDVKLALSEEVRRAIGIRPDQRMWISHWLDTNTRRARAEDVEFEKQELPARGEPGALAKEEIPKEASKTVTKAGKLQNHKNAARNRKLLGLFGTLVFGALIASWLLRNEMRA